MVNFGPLAAGIGLLVWGTPIKFQWVSGLGFVTVPMSLNGGQPHFAQCLAVSWAVTLYIHFRGILPVTKCYQMQNSLSVKVLHSPIFAAFLLHGSQVVDVSPTLRRSAEDASYIWQGGHHVGHRPTF